jgi:hypothetical protein
MPLARIVSGAQTGVDRGALDAALDAQFPCGGWCPGDRQAEDGEIPPRYPVTPLPGSGYRQRTIQNVVDSNATLVIYFGQLQGGTEQTVLHCIKRQKPYKLIDASEVSRVRAAHIAAQFIESKAVAILNIAGPCVGRIPEAQDYAYYVVTELLRLLRLPASGA